VSQTPPSSLVELQRLRLDDAIALLDHDAGVPLPATDLAPAAYLQALIDGLCELSLRDPLTGLGNRRHFRSVLERSIDMVARSGEPALLLMIDIDNFKRVNDNYGHQAGDQVLQAIARLLAASVRPMDTVCRFGGEEFALILPSCHTSYGSAVAERIRANIEAMPVPIAPGLNIHVSVSIGGAFAPEWVRSTTSLWTERADMQLYRAKGEGRNCVFLDSQQEIYVSAEEKNMLFGHLALGEPAWIEGISSESSGPHAGAAVQRFI